MTPPISILTLLPEIILLVGGCAVLLAGHMGGGRSRSLSPWLTLVTLVLAILVVLWENWTGGLGGARTQGNGLAYDGLSHFVRVVALELGVVLTLVNWSQARDEERGEFLSLMLFSITGLVMVGPANDLLMLFLALELVSIPTYIMVVISRTNIRAAEAGTKYFYLGALSAAIMAYGFSLLYGVAGSANLNRVAEAVAAALANPDDGLPYGLATLGLVLSIGGLLFKLAAVPLHFYVADVYQGAASPVAGLLGFVPKLAGLVAIFKIMVVSGQWYVGEQAVFWLLWLVAVVSMCVGNVLALRQTNVKRLLAYSGIAHAGYMLVGVLVGPLAGGGAFGVFGNGTAVVLYYVVIYGIANLGAFAILGLLRARGGPCETLRDLAGLLRREPTLALLMALAMFTLMGLPPTPGFWGKLGLFSSAVAAAQTTAVAGQSTWLIVLVVIAVLNSALAAAYYLRVIAAVLLFESDEPAYALPREAQQIGALLCGLLILFFAFWPNNLLAQSEMATDPLMSAPAVVRRVDPELPVASAQQPGEPIALPPARTGAGGESTH